MQNNGLGVGTQLPPYLPRGQWYNIFSEVPDRKCQNSPENRTTCHPRAQKVLIKSKIIRKSFYPPGPAATAEGLVRTVGMAGGPGSVVGIIKIGVLLVPVAMAA